MVSQTTPISTVWARRPRDEEGASETAGGTERGSSSFGDLRSLPVVSKRA